MPKNLFSLPIFFIVFRETIEAAIIVSVLLGLAEQIVNDDTFKDSSTSTTRTESGTTVQGELDSVVKEKDSNSNSNVSRLNPEEDIIQKRRLLRKLRFQIFLGAGLGLFIALAIGAAFIAIWFTKAADLWAKSEELWEGIFEIIACVMIFVMGLTMLKMDRAKTKWRIKLQKAFDGKNVDGQAKTGKWVLFILPFITVLREGLEAVIFVGGVSLGQPAASIPIAAIVGLVCGFIIGFVIYEFASRTTLTIFLIIMTNFILLIGAGLFSKATLAFQENAFNRLLGGDVDDAGAAGSGPGSYDVRGSVWHLDCCSPDSRTSGGSGEMGWTIFNAVFGWTNNATVGSVLSYVFYWIAVIVALVYMKFKEGRTTLFGYESAAGKRRRERRERRASEKRERERKQMERERKNSDVDHDHDSSSVEKERSDVSREHAPMGVSIGTGHVSGGNDVETLPR